MVELNEDKLSEKYDGDKFQVITDKEKYYDSNNLTNKDLLVASLSRRDIRVKYKKGNISVDKLYVELINTIE